MAKFTHPGSRADLLLTLARLALPDALRRSKQPLAVATFIAVLFLVFATVVTLGLLPAIFAIESDALRRNLLSLIACSVTAIALLAQVLLRAPVTWLLDLEDLLRLPVGFRDLYVLRFALSTIGYWLPVLGPAGVYLAVARSGGVNGAPITLLAILSLVWIFGRTAAILSLLVNRSIEGKLGALAIVAIIAACQGAFMVGALALGGELASEGITRAIEESAVLGGLGYTPPGLVAGIAHQPGPSASNLARLASLFAILGALVVLENRLLLRSYLERPGGDRRAASGSLPVAWLLRRAKRLTPTGVLTLVEIECLLRLRPARLVLAVALGTSLVLVPTAGGFAVGPAALLGIFLNDLRIGKQPPTCHAWRESLTLPFPVRGIFGAPGRAMNVVILFVIAFILGLTPLEWFGWPFFFIAVCLMLAGFLMAAATYGLIQLRWPQRNEGFLHDPDGARLGATLVAVHLVGLPGALSFLFWVLLERQLVTPLTAGLIAAAVLLLAAAAAYASRRRQRRMLATRGRELLLKDPSH
ncbi:MAG: hypothetical protein F4X59_05975 [Holophagales bacterium]|nr:hypothetical protein [Holophagales bacterium]MXX61690.1 hypothetical protein [Holophagales bacterium]MYC09664.1 hypothetical protein [Holophagales bacterium]MYD22649.1 hypothetical protein [Holophagales bacterium]MYI31628.1 hypothetical protein [Holophagales bacterium]